MKKRRTMIIALLLVAALALGIGYANVEGRLLINGKVAAKAQPFNVHFTAFTPGAYTSKIGVNVPTITCDTILSTDAPAKTVILNIGDMASETDSIKATLAVTNDNDCDMYVKVESTMYGTALGSTNNADPDKFTVETDWGTTVKSIAAGDTVNIEVTVTMIDSCTEDYTGAFALTLYGTSVNPAT